MSNTGKILKRFFDFSLAFIGLFFLWWVILIAAFLVYLDTGLNGFFKQKRVGKNGLLFNVVKLRSMRPVDSVTTTITTDKDPRISNFGRFLRKTKLDELPQLWNVLIGKMSFVGPRPDVPGYADQLLDEDRIILTIRPGITGPASLAFRDEEELLAKQYNPQQYNDEVIWPEKVRINKEYIKNYSLLTDIQIIWKTVFG